MVHTLTKIVTMHVHSIKLQNLFFMFVQAIDVMYRLSVYYPLYKYSF